MEKYIFNNTEFLLPGINQTSALVIDHSGKIGILLSSKKFKENIEPFSLSKEIYNQLKPSLYNYKTDCKTNDSTIKKEFGLVAEDIHEIPELRKLVIYDKK